MKQPPEFNPIRWCRQKSRHWANPTELKPGIWLVEEGSGPKSSIRSLAVVTEGAHGWRYVATLRHSYRVAQLHVPWSNNRREWRIVAMDTDTAELRDTMLDIIQKHF